MVTQIGVTLLMAAAAPAGLPAHIVAIPLASDPVLAQPRLRAPRKLTVIQAPLVEPDLRYMAPAADRDDVIKLTPITQTYAVEGAPTNFDAPRVDTLLRRDRGVELTGHRLRRSAMAAGLSLRMTAADGVLASEVGMSGPVGRALARIATEATDPD